MIDQNNVLGEEIDDRQSVLNTEAPPPPLVERSQGRRKGPLILLVVFALVLLGILAWIVIRIANRGEGDQVADTLSTPPAEAAAIGANPPGPVEAAPVVDPALMPPQAQAPAAAPQAEVPMPSEVAGAQLQMPSEAASGNANTVTPLAINQPAPAAAAAPAPAAAPPVPGQGVSQPTQPAANQATPGAAPAAPAPASADVAELTAEIARLKRQLAARISEIEALKRRVKGLGLNLDASKAHGAPAARRSAPSPATAGSKPSTQVAAAPKDGGGVVLKAVVEGRAWLQLRSGETVTVAPGDHVAGVTVVAIDAVQGEVRLSNGTVLR